MPEIIETTVYLIDELSEGAKDKARAWYRQSGFNYFWFDSVYEDFVRVCAILGIDLTTVPVRLYGGGTRQKSCIWFSGFWSQGDGACFEGRYRHAKGAAQMIRHYAPADVELHRITDALHAIQRRHFYQLQATITHRGRYYHEYCMDISVERNGPTYRDVTTDAEEIVIKAMRDLARWLFRQLEAEYEYLTSDETVDEAIAANGYTFTQTGHRFG